MKKHEVALATLALFIVMVACVYSASADVISDYRTSDIDPDTGKVHAVVMLTGGKEGVREGEFFSAANISIMIHQSNDAVIDYLSIEGSSDEGIILTRKGYFEFYSPKLTRGKKITLEFDAIPVKKGDITLGIVDIGYINERGLEDGKRVAINTIIREKKPMSAFPFMILSVIMGVITAFLGIKYLSFKSKVKNTIRNIKDIMEGSRNRRVGEIESDLDSQLRRIGGG